MNDITRKYKFAAVFLILMLNSLGLGSQNIKELYANANKYYESGNYYTALCNLHQIVNSQDQILEKKGAEIHYMYAQSLLYLLENKNDSIFNKLAFSNFSLPLKCFNSFEKSAKSENISASLNKLYPHIIQAANEALDNDLLTYAQNFLSIARQIDSENSINSYFSALIDLKKEDTLLAKNQFISVINNLNIKNPSEAIYISKSYYYLAIINNGFHNNPAIAMQKLDEAFKILNTLIAANKISTKDFSYINNLYQSSRLDIFLNYPEKEEEAIEKFKDAVEKSPNNYSLAISFAQLLSKHHIEEAVNYYLKAIELDPSNYIEYYNLGVIYLNEGVNFYELSTNEQNPKIAKQHYFNYQEKYAEAYVWMQSALERNNEDLKILYSLKRIAAGLYYPDDYQQYDMMITKIEYRNSVIGK